MWLIEDSQYAGGRAGQLSITNAILRPSNMNFLSCSLTHSNLSFECLNVRISLRVKWSILAEGTRKYSTT